LKRHLGRSPNAPEALNTTSRHATHVAVGTLIAHLKDVVIICYAVLLFTVVKPWGEAFALDYGVFKAMEATLLAVAGATWLSLLGLSRLYLQADASAPGAFGSSATLALSQQFWTVRLAALVYLVLPRCSISCCTGRISCRLWGFVTVGPLVLGSASGVGDPMHGFEPGRFSSFR
jgi:hypothetical protein